jgi:hypothetical protein
MKRSIVLSLIAAWSLAAPAAVVFVESFGSGSAGWVDRDPLEMNVLPSVFGNPGFSLEGTFSLLGSPSIQTDAFRATAASSSGNFVGDYASLPDFSGWRFDFVAQTILPSDLNFRISDGANIFTWAVSPAELSVNYWRTVFVPAEFSAGWIGAGATQFNTALTNLQWMEIQVTRNGLSAQKFNIDNVEVLDFIPMPLPEPDTLSFLLIGALIFMMRRRVIRNTSQTDR